jgi:precorrin-3B methylase
MALPETVAKGIERNAAAAELAAARVAASVRKTLQPGDLAMSLAPVDATGQRPSAGRPYAAEQGLVINVYNPKAEASESSIRREMRYLAAGIW